MFFTGWLGYKKKLCSFSMLARRLQRCALLLYSQEWVNILLRMYALFSSFFLFHSQNSRLFSALYLVFTCSNFSVSGGEHFLVS